MRNFYDLLDVLETRVDLDGPYQWSGNTQQGTVMAFLRRLMALAPRLGHLIRVGVESVELSRAVTVVDIHGLHESAQRFVVGCARLHACLTRSRAPAGCHCGS